jgi:hypothetical protein
MYAADANDWCMHNGPASAAGVCQNRSCLCFSFGNGLEGALQYLSSYEFTGRNEHAIREKWVRPLLALLGYGDPVLRRIEYKVRVELQDPLRMLGSTRFEVDYLPTVLNRGLWLVEAKAPTDALSTPRAWKKHLGQEWTYATHPEIRVPLGRLGSGRLNGVVKFYAANGSRARSMGATMWLSMTHSAWRSPVLLGDDQRRAAASANVRRPWCRRWPPDPI